MLCRRVIDYRDLCHGVFEKVGDTVKLLYNVACKRHLAALTAFKTGNILDYQYAALKLNHMSGRAFFHMSFAEKAIHFIPPFRLL